MTKYKKKNYREKPAVADEGEQPEAKKRVGNLMWV